ncbi:MAG: OB-fold nucleic acid binding domain-containing protein, partial [Kiritimatiellae bacterium]|nr:OB-fold nucleic acid binding domain-containing protein [Kiritimatiellia bacterium]
MNGTTDNEYRAQRLTNMQRLSEMGHAPFGGAFRRTGRLAEIRKQHRDGEQVAAAGRLTTVRDMGKAVFADLRDGSDRFQIYVRADVVGEKAFGAFKLLDLGDIIGVEGKLFTTRTGEQTIKVERWRLLAKSLRPLPEKWHGLKDVDARYRQRYLDLIANREVFQRFEKRSQAIYEIRNYLVSRGFVEVETPVLQPKAGGAT